MAEKEKGVFQTEPIGPTLVVVPLVNVSTLPPDEIKAELDAILDSLESRQYVNAVIDMGRVEFFGSEMLGVIHRIWKRIRAQDGKMAICNLSKLGEEVMRVAKFDLIWPIYPTRDAALGVM